MQRSKSPFCIAFCMVGRLRELRLDPDAHRLADLATISQAVFQSVQPVGVISSQPPSFVPSGST